MWLLQQAFLRQWSPVEASIVQAVAIPFVHMSSPLLVAVCRQAVWDATSVNGVDPTDHGCQPHGLRSTLSDAGLLDSGGESMVDQLVGNVSCVTGVLSVPMWECNMNFFFF